MRETKQMIEKKEMSKENITILTVVLLNGKGEGVILFWKIMVYFAGEMFSSTNGLIRNQYGSNLVF